MLSQQFGHPLPVDPTLATAARQPPPPEVRDLVAEPDDRLSEWGDSRSRNARKSTYVDPSAKEIPERNVKRALSRGRLGEVISDVERNCGRNTHNASLPSRLRLEIPAYNLVPIWSVTYFGSILNHLKSAR